MLKKRVLIIEDEFSIAELIKVSFPSDDFIIEICGNATDGLEAVKRKIPDVLILDWELPDFSGPQLIKIIKSDKKFVHVPVVMLTVRRETRDITNALAIGADDYITKPFKPQELLSRVKAVLRRSENVKIVVDTIHKGCIELNTNRRTVKVKGKEVDLTPKEFQLLFLLLKKSGSLVSYSEIAGRIWGSEAVDDEIIGSKVRVLIQRIKSKLSVNAGNKIISKYGEGYLFED
jgi:DNA-binding response OmpR family regulator